MVALRHAALKDRGPARRTALSRQFLSATGGRWSAAVHDPAMTVLALTSTTGGNHSPWAVAAGLVFVAIFAVVILARRR